MEDSATYKWAERQFISTGKGSFWSQNQTWQRSKHNLKLEYFLSPSQVSQRLVEIWCYCLGHLEAAVTTRRGKLGLF